ncbi:uncharacterized protein LOC126741208 [Anthonomus grandis grandis]|uniref:uncharacterized protein LOC126741208 n=1 Tax=Anthonomus grandis grandis TaxID=2921223 RepID=UPI0021654BFB|nr:uncharacterized protein LOC126741208 [Anthonomus grandis grandis]
MSNRDKLEKLDDLIKGTIEGQLVEQTVESLLPPGENYGSVMYKVDFKVKNEGEEKTYHAVAKCTPLNKVTQEFFNTQHTFKSEIGWYTTVIPLLKKCAQDYGLERELDFFQQYYGARTSLDQTSNAVDIDGVILTENLKSIGYDNVDRHVGFDKPHTESFLKDLATFHAVPLAIRTKDPELFEKQLKPYCSTLLRTDLIKDFDNLWVQYLKDIPETEPYMERVKKTIQAGNPFGPREIREPWVTIVHVDMWCNNVMVTGPPNYKNIILDLQIPLVGSPAGDLIFFLLTSVALDTVKDHLDYFIKLYYDYFIGDLEQMKVDTSVFTFEAFLEEIRKEMVNAEFLHALGHTQAIFQNKGESMMDSSDENFTMDKIEGEVNKMRLNEKQIVKIRWITLESAKRNWLLE